jgi:hypothetical protein
MLVVSADMFLTTAYGTSLGRCNIKFQGMLAKADSEFAKLDKTWTKVDKNCVTSGISRETKDKGPNTTG